MNIYLTPDRVTYLVEKITKLSNKDIAKYLELAYNSYSYIRVAVYGDGNLSKDDQGEEFVRQLMGELNSFISVKYLNTEPNYFLVDASRINMELRCRGSKIIAGLIPAPDPPPPPPPKTVGG